MTHSAGGPFGLLVAEARPNLVKATVIIEGAGSGFAGGNRWGMSTIPVTYDPPVADAAEIKTRVGGEPRAGRRRLLPAGGAGTQAAQPAEHQGPVRDGRCVVRLAGQPRRRRVPQAGRRAGRGTAPRQPRHPGQRPHDDGREEQPRGAEADHRLDEQERHRQQRPGTGARRHGERLAGAEAGRQRHLLGGHRTPRRCPTAPSSSARCSCSTSSRRSSASRCRWCSCTAAAAR